MLYLKAACTECDWAADTDHIVPNKGQFLAAAEVARNADTHARESEASDRPHQIQFSGSTPKLRGETCR